ncbi:conserved oligomeric Golgi complex subunit 6 isoform X2 [Bacillus rossius redtenbacheri]|uniref:conserved oligomeric Golgi complex subunit 6 isoform X2 n=1 Tax=Bacillus rossius redtenbacheri TaxID=93214 RepID=UPI002FDE8693
MAGPVNSSNIDEAGEKEPNILSKRLNKILETRLENDKDTLEALKELSTFFTENTLLSRRNLRSKIEKRSIVINEDFLSEFREVKDALDDIYNDVSAMNNSVQNMTSRLQSTKTQTQDLIEQTTKLQAESQKVSLQQEVVSAFLRSFQLTPAEQVALRGVSRDAAITHEFFVVLERVKKIHTDCRTLMQSGHQTAALDIMEQMSLYQETALERLYRWTQTNCRNIESAETSPLLTQSMAYLQDRPVLFKYVVDEYCTSRRSVLVRAFIDALTQGGPGGTPKPIEMHAHDPKRYIGDMLAWLHQTIPTEKENLLVLLKGCDRIDVSENQQEALANITEGVCHPLKVRVEHILTSDIGPIVMYGITNLVYFYKQVICEVVPGGPLESLLADLERQCRQAFLAALQQQVKQLLGGRALVPPSDLSPAPGLAHALGTLREVLSVASMAEGRQEDIVKIVSCVVDPLLQAVNESAARLSTTDMAVYLLNCLYQIQSTLSLYEFMDERLERLQAQSDAQLDTLTSEQASSLVANLNLGPIYTILQDQGRGSLSSVPGMDPASLKTFMVGLLMSSAHRAAVQRRAFEVIAAVYQQLHAAVHEPANQYQGPELLAPRSPQEVRRLLLPPS